MKPETPRRLSLDNIFTPELSNLDKMFRRHGYELRIAGGAVRDLLSDKVPSDLDFATTATPDQMKNMFELENIRMINKRGEQHGTVTCRINDKVTLKWLLSFLFKKTSILWTTLWIFFLKWFEFRRSELVLEFRVSELQNEFRVSKLLLVYPPKDYFVRPSIRPQKGSLISVKFDM